MKDRVELLTQRLRLRRARRGDAPVLFRNYTGDQNCSRFLQRHGHLDVASTEAMLGKWYDAAWDQVGTPFSWVISTRDGDEAIGVFVVIPEGHKTEIHFGVLSCSGAVDWSLKPARLRCQRFGGHTAFKESGLCVILNTHGQGEFWRS